MEGGNFCPRKIVRQRVLNLTKFVTTKEVKFLMEKQRQKLSLRRPSLRLESVNKRKKLGRVMPSLLRVEWMTKRRVLGRVWRKPLSGMNTTEPGQNWRMTCCYEWGVGWWIGKITDELIQWKLASLNLWKLKKYKTRKLKNKNTKN